MLLKAHKRQLDRPMQYELQIQVGDQRKVEVGIRKLSHPANRWQILPKALLINGSRILRL